MKIRTWLKIEEKYILQCYLNVEPFRDQYTEASITWFDINYWKTIEYFLKPLLKQCLNHLKEKEVNVKFFGATPYDVDDVSLQLKYELKQRNKLHNSVVQPKSDKGWETAKCDEDEECHNYGGLFETVTCLDYVLHISVKKIGTLQRVKDKEEIDSKSEETSTYFPQNEDSSLNSLSLLKSSLPRMKYGRKNRKCMPKFENESNLSNSEDSKELKIDQFFSPSSSTQSKPDTQEDPLTRETPESSTDSLFESLLELREDDYLKPKLKRAKDERSKAPRKIPQKDINKYFEKKNANSEMDGDVKNISLSAAKDEINQNKSKNNTDVHFSDSVKENLSLNFSHCKRKLQSNNEDEEFKKVNDLNDFRDKNERSKKSRKCKKVVSLRNFSQSKIDAKFDTLKQIRANSKKEFKSAEEGSITPEQKMSDDQLAKLTKLFNDIVSRKTLVKEPSTPNLNENWHSDKDYDEADEEELNLETKSSEKCEWLGKVKKSILKTIVQRNWSKLKDIACGKKYSRRHRDYVRGGRAKIDLTFQVHLSHFTENQIDYIMDLLIPEFYKGSYEDMDYILKVLLPEMLIIVYMELNGTTHKESDKLMSEAVFKVSELE